MEGDLDPRLQRGRVGARRPDKPEKTLREVVRSRPDKPKNTTVSATDPAAG